MMCEFTDIYNATDNANRIG